MKHFNHDHLLILNENYIAREGDACRGCNDQIFSCKSFVYSCGRSISGSTSADTSGPVDDECLRFLLHKNCAELPPRLEVPLLESCDEFPKNLLSAEVPKTRYYIRVFLPESEPYFELFPRRRQRRHRVTSSCGFYDPWMRRGRGRFVTRMRTTSGLRHFDFISLYSTPIKPTVWQRHLHHTHQSKDMCAICGLKWKWFSYCHPDGKFFVCLKCAICLFSSVEDTKFPHPAHTQHPLALIQNLSSFKCYACKVEDNIKDFSYICTICQFWIHKSCADAPTSFLFPFHDKHPLILTFSLPKVYRKFAQYCRLCHETLNRLNWQYYCSKCRFFVHFQCARSNRMLISSSENDMYPDLVHLPATDESSLLEKFVKVMMSTLVGDNDSSLSDTTNHIKDWAHDEHQLQLITINELHNQNDIDVTLLLCDGCVKPIRTDDEQCYGCVTCKYFLHKVCAELPKEIEHHLWPGLKLFAFKFSERENIVCNVCGDICNGIIFSNCSMPLHSSDVKLHIECAMLPKMIKHEAHPHQLIQLHTTNYDCKACGQNNTQCKHSCESCDFYICAGCIMKAATLKHRWDPHPLNLVYDSSMVMDHEHDFNCELCSEDIDTNYWFYHCNDCDLSFHQLCSNTNTFTPRQTVSHNQHRLIFSPCLPRVYHNIDRFCGICTQIIDLFEWIYYCTDCRFFSHFDCVKNENQILSFQTGETRGEER